MSEVTQLLDAMSRGDADASAKLFPVVYDELRHLARSHMGRERTEHTLQATALVHEAYLRLIGDINHNWEGRRHFFAAAAEAMRRILIEHARHRKAAKRGGGMQRSELDNNCLDRGAQARDLDQLIEIDDALTRFALEDPKKAELVKLRYFGGLSIEEAAEALGVSPATAKRYWTYARAWLYNELDPPVSNPTDQSE